MGESAGAKTPCDSFRLVADPESVGARWGLNSPKGKTTTRLPA
jgi:hypothetical protein